MGRPGVAGKKRTRRGGRDPGDPPLRRRRCLCPWSKQRGNPPFSSARRAHSYSNHSAAGPRAATFPGRREPPPHLPSASPGPLLPHFHLHRGGVPGKAASPTRTPGLLTNSAAGCGGPRGWRRGEPGDMGRGRDPDADRLTYRVMGRGEGGGVGVPEIQRDVVLGRDKETRSQRRNGDRDSEARRPGATRRARDKGYKSSGEGEPAPHPLLPSALLVSQTGDGNLRLQFPLPHPLLPRMSADLRGRNSRRTPSALLQGPTSKSNSRRKRDLSPGERKRELGPLVSAQETPRARAPSATPSMAAPRGARAREGWRGGQI